MLKSVEYYYNMEDFTFEKARGVSSYAAFLCQWCRLYFEALQVTYQIL